MHSERYVASPSNTQDRRPFSELDDKLDDVFFLKEWQTAFRRSDVSLICEYQQTFRSIRDNRRRTKAHRALFNASSID